MSDTTFSARAAAMQIPSLPPGVTLTTLENGLTNIVRGSPSHGTVASRNHRVKMTL
jgi:predicted Zn-dependent peptidase